MARRGYPPEFRRRVIDLIDGEVNAEPKDEDED